MSEEAPQTPQAPAQPVANAEATVQPSGKSATVATILSCIFPGVGQIYLGQIPKGIVMLLLCIILGPVTLGLVSFVVWIVAMLDANKIGKKLENGTAVKPWEFF